MIAPHQRIYDALLGAMPDGWRPEQELILRIAGVRSVRVIVHPPPVAYGRGCYFEVTERSSGYELYYVAGDGAFRRRPGLSLDEVTQLVFEEAVKA